MRTIAFVVACSVASLAVGTKAQGQPTFEVASIKRNLSSPQGAGLAGTQPGRRFMAVGITLRRQEGQLPKSTQLPTPKRFRKNVRLGDRQTS